VSAGTRTIPAPLRQSERGSCHIATPLSAKSLILKAKLISK